MQFWIITANTPSCYFTMDTFREAIMASSCQMQIPLPLPLVYGTKGIPFCDSTLLLIKPGRPFSNLGNTGGNDRVFINWDINYSTSFWFFFKPFWATFTWKGWLILRLRGIICINIRWSLAWRPGLALLLISPHCSLEQASRAKGAEKDS